MNNTQSVIITGASDGIGRGLAEAFAKKGFRIGLIARREPLLEEVAGVCRKNGSPQTEIAALDITESEKFRAALKELDQKLGGCSIFVANAGFGDTTPAHKDCGELARRMSALNVSAALDGLEMMKALFVKRGSGHIVGIASVAGFRGLPDAAVYSATKSALRIYLEALRLDLKPYKIPVTTVNPGFIATAPNLARKDVQPMPFLMSVPKASTIFVDGILRKRSYVIAPWQFRPVTWLLQWIPSFIFDVVMAFGRKRVQ